MSKFKTGDICIVTKDDECSLKEDYYCAAKAEIKRDCYNQFVKDLKQLIG